MPATIYYFTLPYITFNLDRLNSQKYKSINSENNEYFIHTKQVKQGNNQFTQYTTMLKRLRLKDKQQQYQEDKPRLQQYPLGSPYITAEQIKHTALYNHLFKILEYIFNRSPTPLLTLD